MLEFHQPMFCKRALFFCLLSSFFLLLTGCGKNTTATGMVSTQSGCAALHTEFMEVDWARGYSSLKELKQITDPGVQGHFTAIAGTSSEGQGLFFTDFTFTITRVSGTHSTRYKTKQAVSRFIKRVVALRIHSTRSATIPFFALAKRLYSSFTSIAPAIMLLMEALLVASSCGKALSSQSTAKASSCQQERQSSSFTPCCKMPEKAILPRRAQYILLKAEYYFTPIWGYKNKRLAFLAEIVYY